MNVIVNVVIVFTVLIILYIIILLVKNRNIYFGKTDNKFYDSESGLPIHVNIEELGNIEGNLELLDEVIVIAHTIEKPEGNLYNAMWSNFSKGVKYTFLISPSQILVEQNGFIRIFEAIANVAKQKTSVSPNLRDLLTLKSLAADWDDYPYIFYRIKTIDDNLEMYYTFAYRGTQKKEGIADNYELIKPAVAHTISKAVMAGAKDESLKRLKSEEFEVKKENIGIININRNKNGTNGKSAEV